MNGFASQPVISLVAIALLTLLPFAFMVTTSFVKIAVVFSILRNGLGTGQVPSGMIITALAGILTLYVMAPVGQEMVAASASSFAKVDRAKPLSGTNLDAFFAGLKQGEAPLRKFLSSNAGSKERQLFVDLAQRQSPGAEIDPNKLLIVLPAFLITELSEAFQIGFLVFLPFLVIDMVVANVLLALGMHMLSPTTVSLPFKLLLFVMVDGWYLLSRALVLTYA